LVFLAGPGAAGAVLMIMMMMIEVMMEMSTFLDIIGQTGQTKQE
jgi:hypothetical protein